MIGWFSCINVVLYGPLQKAVISWYLGLHCLLFDGFVRSKTQNKYLLIITGKIIIAKHLSEAVLGCSLSWTHGFNFPEILGQHFVSEFQGFTSCFLAFQVLQLNISHFHSHLNCRHFMLARTQIVFTPISFVLSFSPYS